MANLVEAEPASPTKKVGTVTVQAFADCESLSPGATANLAVSLTMDEGWHVYWRSPGGLTGIPTKIQWKLPEGFQYGRTLFPSPRAKYEPTLEETSYIHSDRAVFITPIRVPESVKAGHDVTLSVEVSWLACKKECIPGRASVALTMPVLAKGSAAKPANMDLFAKARKALPEPIEKMKHVTLSLSMDPNRPKPGDTAKAILGVDIARGHHMQSNKPKLEELIACVLFVEPIEGVEIGDVVYPKAQERQDKVLGLLSEYSGRIDLIVPLTLEKETTNAGRWLRGVVQYQLCNNTGTCYAPQWTEFSFPIQFAGGTAPKVDDGYFTSTSPPSVVSRSTGYLICPEEDGQSGASHDSNAKLSFFGRIECAFLRFGFTGVLCLAAIGGLMLNFMPCVLPVISLKVLSFVRQSGQHRSHILLLGVSYSAGIMVFFGLLAVLFWQTGQGWGQHLQRPQVILILAAIVMAFALSLFGVFSVFAPRIISELEEKVEGEGPGSAFVTGILATMLGTACTAPMLSAAVGAASRYPGPQGGLIFLAVGFGMALPFLVLAAQPAWLRFVPKPGPWMGAFESLMGFLLLGTAIWLLNPLRDQIGDWGLLLSLIFLLFVAMTAWVKGRVRFEDPFSRKLKLFLISMVILALGWLIPFQWISTIPQLREEVAQRRKYISDGRLFALLPDSVKREPQKWNPDWSKGIPWLEFDPERVALYAATGYTVFIDYTASWCVNCKANLRTSIDIEATRALFRDLNVVTFEADYTNEDPAIKESLEKFGKAGVPLYLVYSPYNPDTPEVLPEILTPGIVADALHRAGPSRVSLASTP